MPKALMIVYTDPVNESEEERYNHWYTDIHVPEILETPGFVAVTRYELSESQFIPAGDSHRYLAIWEVEAEDVAEAAAALQKQAIEGNWNLDDSIDPASISIRFYEPLTERIEKP